MVSVWLVQATGLEYHVIDYIEDSRKAIDFYLRALQLRPYLWGTDWLPWDGAAKNLGTGKSIQEMMRASGRNSVRVVPRLSVTDGINAVRTVFPMCWIDSEKCADGLHGLRHYRWPENSEGNARREPMHDLASHPADAFRTFAVAIKQPERDRQAAQKHVYAHDGGPNAWMRI